MESKKLGSKIYLRVDKGEDVLESIIETCKEYDVKSATFSGLGACQKVVIGTYMPEKDDFQLHTKETMLEMINLTGNVTYDLDSKSRKIHAHGIFSYLGTDGEIHYFGGDLKKAEIMYTGEITVEPVEGIITKKYDSNVKIDVWNFK